MDKTERDVSSWTETRGIDEPLEEIPEELQEIIDNGKYITIVASCDGKKVYVTTQGVKKAKSIAGVMCSIIMAIGTAFATQNEEFHEYYKENLRNCVNDNGFWKYMKEKTELIKNRTKQRN